MKTALTLLLTGVALSAANPAADLERVASGKPAPDFTLPDKSGKSHALSDYRGGIVVLVFYRGHW